MSNAEFVINGLREADKLLREAGYNPNDHARRSLAAAIAALSAQDDVRDRVLEALQDKANAMSQATFSKQDIGTLCRAVARDLKSKPVAPEDVCMCQPPSNAMHTVSGQGYPNCNHCNKPVNPSWLTRNRADGSTTPRTGPEDRRESAYGNGFERRARMQYGRRKDDRARWTAALEVECDVMQTFDDTWADDPTPPAQKAPQSLAVPILLWCPGCGSRHIDEGEFATKLHHTHACQQCGNVWRPAIVPTCGVQFLPGFKNSELDRRMGGK